jgi:hypothetical protein
LPLDFPFVYNGVDALLWDVRKDNDPGTVYAHDWIATMPAFAFGALPEVQSAGCTTANGTMLHRVGLRTNGSTLDFGFRVAGAPSSANVGLLIGFSSLGAPFPGLCALIGPNPVINLPTIGVADAAGDVPLAFSISAPWTAGAADVPLYTQAFAMDPTQPGLPLALSGGLLTRTPATTVTAGTNVMRVFNTGSSSAATGTLATSAAPTISGL